MATVAAPPAPGPYTALAVSGSTVWVGGPGFVADSANGGASWTTDGLAGTGASDITFSDSTHGWLYGTMIGSCVSPSPCENVLLATTNGGRSWLPRATFKHDSLSAIQFVSPTTGYAERSPEAPCKQPTGCARLVRTTDGGRTWLPVPAPTPAGSGLHFADANHGWMVGARCAGSTPCRIGIYVTADGGAAWTEQLATNVPVDQGGGTLAFAGPAHGWALIDDTAYCSMGGCWGALYRTTNGGRTWSKLQPVDRWHMTAIDTPPGFPGQPAFTSAQAGWIPIEAGAGPGVGGVAWTVDGGRTWTRAGQRRLWDIHAVATSDGSTVWAIGDRHGDEPTTSYLIRSTDGGGTWAQVLPALSPLTTVDFIDAAHGYGIGLPSDPGAVLATADGGHAWRLVGRITGGAPTTASFVGRRGWVGDASGRILRSADGGHTWIPLPPAPDPVVDLRFFSATHGVRITSHLAAGVQTAEIAATTNGGETWSATHTVPAGAQLAAAAFADPMHGLLVTLQTGSGYLLRRTTDGGATWRQVARLPLQGYAQRSAFLLSPSVGWVGDGSRILATTDGGARWTARALGSYTPQALDFISPRTGWMVDTAGTLLATTDGGATWRATVDQPPTIQTH